MHLYRSSKILRETRETRIDVERIINPEREGGKSIRIEPRMSIRG